MVFEVRFTLLYPTLSTLGLHAWASVGPHRESLAIAVFMQKGGYSDLVPCWDPSAPMAALVLVTWSGLADHPMCVL